MSKALNRANPNNKSSNMFKITPDNIQVTKHKKK